MPEPQASFCNSLLGAISARIAQDIRRECETAPRNRPRALGNSVRRKCRSAKTEPLRHRIKSLTNPARERAVWRTFSTGRRRLSILLSVFRIKLH